MPRRDFGVAIGLPEPFTSELQGWRERLGDPFAHGIPPHVTLLPPTSLREQDLPVVEGHLKAIAWGEAPFEVHLRGSGTFRPVSPVVFVSMVEGISQCERLAEVVRQGPLAVPVQYPYHPHVTVAHHMPETVMDRAFDELAGFDCTFGAAQFQLYRHDEENGWRPAREFALAPTS